MSETGIIIFLCVKFSIEAMLIIFSVIRILSEQADWEKP